MVYCWYVIIIVFEGFLAILVVQKKPREKNTPKISPKIAHFKRITAFN